MSGRVVGGLEVLRNIEQVPTDEQDRPRRPLMIAKAIVLVNPFEELDELLKREQEFEKKRLEAMNAARPVEKRPVPSSGVSQSSGVSHSSASKSGVSHSSASKSGVSHSSASKSGVSHSSMSKSGGLGHLLDLGSDDEEERKKQILEQLEKQSAAHSERVAYVEKKQKKSGFGDFSSW